MTSVAGSRPVISKSIHTNTSCPPMLRDRPTCFARRLAMAPSWSWPRRTGMTTPRSRGGSPSRESRRWARSAAGSASWRSTAGRWRSGTDRIATAAAEASGASLYAVLQPPPDPEHVPSTLVRPAESPTLARFIDHVDVVVTLHGYGRSGMFTALLLGGRNRGLAATIGERLRPALDGYDVVTDLDGHPARAARPAPRQPGQPAAPRRRADRAAAAGARARAEVGRLARTTGSCRRPRRSSTCSPASPPTGRPTRRIGPEVR